MHRPRRLLARALCNHASGLICIGLTTEKGYVVWICNSRKACRRIRASAGIGRETVKILAEEGVKTIVIGRNEAALQTLAKEIADKKGPVPPVDDLNERDAIARVRDKVLSAVGGVDFLINNLGQSRGFGLDTPDEDWDEAFELNFTPPRKLAQAFLPGMIERRFGRIICLTATTEPGNVSGSVTSKAALVIWAKGLSRLVGKDGITRELRDPGNHAHAADSEQRLSKTMADTKEGPAASLSGPGDPGGVVSENPRIAPTSSRFCARTRRAISPGSASMWTVAGSDPSDRIYLGPMLIERIARRSTAAQARSVDTFDFVVVGAGTGGCGPWPSPRRAGLHRMRARGGSQGQPSLDPHSQRDHEDGTGPEAHLAVRHRRDRADEAPHHAGLLRQDARRIERGQWDGLQPR